MGHKKPANRLEGRSGRGRKPGRALSSPFSPFFAVFRPQRAFFQP